MRIAAAMAIAVLAASGCDKPTNSRSANGASAADSVSIPMVTYTEAEPPAIPAATTMPSTAPAPQFSSPHLRAAASANALRVDLSWEYSGGQPSAFLIERSTNGTDFVRIGFVDADVMACRDTRGLQPSTTYWYRVIAWSKTASAPSQPQSATTSPFHLFEATLFAQKPNLGQSGLEPLCVGYESEFFLTTRPVPDTPDEARTRAVARKAARLGQILVIDIEKWLFDIRKASPETVQGNIRKMVQVIQWIRSESPTTKVGIYAQLPICELAAVAKNDPKQLREWHEANAFLMPLANHVDYLFPSFYTFHDRPALWQRFAKANAEEARQYGKPIYPFVWMCFHTGEPAAVTGPRINGDFWRLELDTIRGLADGMVIWGGYQETWNPRDPWWQATTEFVETMSASPAATQPSADRPR